MYVMYFYPPNVLRTMAQTSVAQMFVHWSVWPSVRLSLTQRDLCRNAEV